MVYVLEGTSVSLATTVAGKLQNTLNLPPEAFSYLSSHGALDIEHIGDFENVVNRLENPVDRQVVEDSAKIFFRLYGNVLRSIDSGESV